MKVIKARQLISNPKHYDVSVVSEGMLVNGFIYARESRSLQMPKNYKGHAVVRMRGMHVIRLREKIEQFIESSSITITRDEGGAK